MSRETFCPHLSETLYIYLIYRKYNFIVIPIFGWEQAGQQVTVQEFERAHILQIIDGPTFMAGRRHLNYSYLFSMFWLASHTVKSRKNWILSVFVCCSGLVLICSFSLTGFRHGAFVLEMECFIGSGLCWQLCSAMLVYYSDLVNIKWHLTT